LPYAAAWRRDRHDERPRRPRALPRRRAGDGSFDRIIVVHNDSSDGSPDLARERRCVVVHKRRGGYGEAINAGARQARGEFFAVLNADIRFLSPDTVPRLAHTSCTARWGSWRLALELSDGRLQDSAGARRLR